MRSIACTCLLTLTLFLSLVFFVGVPAATAADKSGTTLDEAVKHIKAKPGVRVLAAERVTKEGKKYYRIKVLTSDGRVKYIWIDPGS